MKAKREALKPRWPGIRILINRLLDFKHFLVELSGFRVKMIKNRPLYCDLKVDIMETKLGSTSETCDKRDRQPLNFDLRIEPWIIG